MTLIALLTLAFILVYQYRNYVNNDYIYTHKQARLNHLWVLPVAAHIKPTLEKHFPFYQQLSEHNKSIFKKRVAYFKQTKKFIPRGIKHIPSEVKTFIAASAIQLTFGLPHVSLSHFDKILVYPDDYYSSITKQYHKGEVNPRFGIIVLSLRSFMESHFAEGGSQHLGLHEMAHALRLENIIHDDSSKFFNPQYLRAFDEFAKQQCEHPEEDPFFRAYACTNVHEFFAVAVENFFERPQEFLQQEPKLYEILTKLLRLNPLAIHDIEV
jgi:Mlc titration factor MtfA (ptsG expression regulator)